MSAGGFGFALPVQLQVFAATTHGAWSRFSFATEPFTKCLPMHLPCLGKLVQWDPPVAQRIAQGILELLNRAVVSTQNHADSLKTAA
jgi:hypothetical protein